MLSLATFEKPRFWALYAQHSGRAVGYSVHRGSWGFHAEGIQAIPPGYIPKQRKFGTAPTSVMNRVFLYVGDCGTPSVNSVQFGVPRDCWDDSPECTLSGVNTRLRLAQVNVKALSLT